MAAGRSSQAITPAESGFSGTAMFQNIAASVTARADGRRVTVTVSVAAAANPATDARERNTPFAAAQVTGDVAGTVSDDARWLPATPSTRSLTHLPHSC